MKQEPSAGTGLRLSLRVDMVRHGGTGLGDRGRLWAQTEVRNGQTVWYQNMKQKMKSRKQAEVSNSQASKVQGCKSPEGRQRSQ